MAPGATDEGFSSELNGLEGLGDHVEDVVIAGAGPAGLMLGYVDFLCWKMRLLPRSYATLH
jgi:hypothetical protein